MEGTELLTGLHANFHGGGVGSFQAARRAVEGSQSGNEVTSGRILNEVRRVLGYGRGEPLSESDATEIFQRNFQRGVLTLFEQETKRLDPSWVDLKTERERLIFEWLETPAWERVKRHRKTWAEKGAEFLQCGIRRRLLSHDGGDCGKRYCVPEYCRMRGCPVCGELQADECFEQWAPRLLGIWRYSPKVSGQRYKFRHLTFTGPKPKERPTPEELHDEFQRFLSLVSEFLREFYPGSPDASKRFPKRHGCGFLAQGEVGRDDDGLANWNVHAHVIVFGPFYWESEMKPRWSELSGASGYGLELQKIDDEHGLLQSLRHMFKYYKKPFSYDPETYVSTILGMDGVRLRRGGGIFYKDRRGSRWGEKVEAWEERTRAEMMIRGQIRERELRCFQCGERLVPNYRLGVLWPSQIRALGCADYQEVQKNQGAPRNRGSPGIGCEPEANLGEKIDVSGKRSEKRVTALMW